MQSKWPILIRFFSRIFYQLILIIRKNIEELIYSRRHNSVEAQLLQSVKNFMTKLMLHENDYIPPGKTLMKAL